MKILALIWLLPALALGGCTNFQVVSEFAQATKQVTAPVREEMGFITATCVQQAALRGGFEFESEDPFKRVVACQGTDKVLQGLQRETVAVMDLYANALLALADNKNLDLSADIDATTKKLTKIQSGAQSAVSAAQAAALSKILALIGDVLLTRERDQGIRRLVDASPDLAQVGRTLNRFFKPPEGGGGSPYDALIALTQAEAAAVERTLQSNLVAKADPLRAAERRFDQWKVMQALHDRAQPGPKNPGTLLAQAIDAWIDSMPVFREQALKPDPEALLKRIGEFRSKAVAASEAAQAAF